MLQAPSIIKHSGNYSVIVESKSHKMALTDKLLKPTTSVYQDFLSGF